MNEFPGPLKRKQMRGGPYELTPEQEAWFKETYPVTKNSEVEKAMGIAWPTLYQIAHRLGVTKSEEGMRAIRKSNGKRCSQRIQHQKLLMMSGLPHTAFANIRLQPYTKQQMQCRYRGIHRYGYITYEGHQLYDGDKERYCIYYDVNTKRNGRYEANAIAMGFKILPYDDFPEETKEL